MLNVVCEHNQQPQQQKNTCNCICKTYGTAANKVSEMNVNGCKADWGVCRTYCQTALKFSQLDKL